MAQLAQVMTLNELRIRASDVTGQRSKSVRAPREATIRELVQSLIGEMGLKSKDAAGNPHAYRARLEREGRHLNASELVGDVLREDDHLVLQPNVDAG